MNEVNLNTLQTASSSPTADEGKFLISNGLSIGIILKGEAEVKINGISRDLSPNTVFILPPNGTFEMIREIRPIEKWTLDVTLEVILEYPTPLDTDIITMARYSPVLRVSNEKLERMKDIIALMRREYDDTANSYRNEICKSLLHAILLEISDEYRQSENIRGSEKMKQEKLSDDFFILLSQWHRKERQVQFYAEKLNRTPKYLTGAIKKITGRSIKEWINETVIIDIKSLLKSTDMTVLEISEEMNFPNPSAFVQFFKLHTGMTPLQYRKS